MRSVLICFGLLVLLGFSAAHADTGSIPAILFDSNGCKVERSCDNQFYTGSHGSVQMEGLTGYYYFSGCSSFGSDYPIIVDLNNNHVPDICQLDAGVYSSDAVCMLKDGLLKPYFSSYESSHFVRSEHIPRVQILQGNVFDPYAGTDREGFTYYFGQGSYVFKYNTGDARYGDLVATGYSLYQNYSGDLPMYIANLANSFNPIVVTATSTPTNYVNPKYFFHRKPIVLPGGASYKEILLPVDGHLIKPLNNVPLYELIIKKILKKRMLTLPKR